MAITRLNNVIHADATGLVTSSINQKIVQIILTSDTAGDTLVLRETSSGSDKLTLKAANADESVIFDFHLCPLVFTNGIYIQTLTSGAKAMLVLTSGGGSGQ